MKGTVTLAPLAPEHLRHPAPLAPTLWHLRHPWHPWHHIACLVLVLVAGCASNPTRPSEVVLGQSFELRAGRSARLADGLEIRFDSVRSDSRCPIDVVCVTAGDATVAISVTPAAGGRVERELHTQPAGAETVVNDYRIRLVSLAPSPRSNRQIPADDYVATLTVSRR